MVIKFDPAAIKLNIHLQLVQCSAASAQCSILGSNKIYYYILYTAVCTVTTLYMYHWCTGIVRLNVSDDIRL
jgi:hypothetical protein